MSLSSLIQNKKIHPDVVSAILTLSDRLNKLEKNHSSLKQATHPAPYYAGQTVKFGTRTVVVEECTTKVAKIRYYRDYGHTSESLCVDPQLLSPME